MESFKNSSTVPLPAGGVFIGTYEDVSSYESAVITVFSTTSCEILAFQSQDKKKTYQQGFVSQANTLTTFFISPFKFPYIYFTCRNTESQNQSILNFNVSYKNVNQQINAGGQNVNIFLKISQPAIIFEESSLN